MGGAVLWLLAVLIVAAVIFAIVSYVTGGIFWFGKTDPEEDRMEPARDEADGRPTHTRPTTPAQESTAFVGTPRGDRARERH
jgi:hypothetical protein